MGSPDGPQERFDWISVAVVLAVLFYLLGLSAVAVWAWAQIL